MLFEQTSHIKSWKWDAHCDIVSGKYYVDEYEGKDKNISRLKYRNILLFILFVQLLRQCKYVETDIRFNVWGRTYTLVDKSSSSC